MACRAATGSEAQIISLAEVWLPPPPPLRYEILAIDGSPGSEEAVGAVAARMWPAGSVKVIIVDDPLVPPIIGDIVPPLAKTIEESNAEYWTRALLRGSCS